MAAPGRPVKAACAEVRQRLSGGAMTKAEEGRKQRLAEALRQNLRRRKAQARGDEAMPAAPPLRHSRESGNPDEA